MVPDIRDNVSQASWPCCSAAIAPVENLGVQQHTDRGHTPVKKGTQNHCIFSKSFCRLKTPVEFATPKKTKGILEKNLD